MGHRRSALVLWAVAAVVSSIHVTASEQSSKRTAADDGVKKVVTLLSKEHFVLCSLEMQMGETKRTTPAVTVGLVKENESHKSVAQLTCTQTELPLFVRFKFAVNPTLRNASTKLRNSYETARNCIPGQSTKVRRSTQTLPMDTDRHILPIDAEDSFVVYHTDKVEGVVVIPMQDEFGTVKGKAFHITHALIYEKQQEQQQEQQEQQGEEEEDEEEGAVKATVKPATRCKPGWAIAVQPNSGPETFYGAIGDLFEVMTFELDEDTNSVVLQKPEDDVHGLGKRIDNKYKVKCIIIKSHETTVQEKATVTLQGLWGGTTTFYVERFGKNKLAYFRSNALYQKAKTTTKRVGQAASQLYTEIVEFGQRDGEMRLDFGF